MTTKRVEQIAEHVKALRDNEREEFSCGCRTFSESKVTHGTNRLLKIPGRAGDWKWSWIVRDATLPREGYSQWTKSLATPDFWMRYRKLPLAIQRKASGCVSPLAE